MKVTANNTTITVELSTSDYKQVLIEFLKARGLDFTDAEGNLVLPNEVISFNWLYDRNN